MKKVFAFLKGGIIGAGESTLIPSIIREVKDFKKKKDRIKYGNPFDLNNDGVVDHKDVSELTLEKFGKYVAILLVIYLANRFGITDFIIQNIDLINKVLSLFQ